MLVRRNPLLRRASACPAPPYRPLASFLLPALLVAIFGVPSAMAAPWGNGAGGGGGGASGKVNSGASGQLGYYSGSGTTISGTTIGGDCTFAAPSTFTCTKTNGVSFAPSATINTTNASNISAGTLSAARLPALGGDTTSVAGSAVTTTQQVHLHTRAITGTGTADTASCSTDQVITINSTGGNFIENLPATTGLPPNCSFLIINLMTSANVTITPNAANGDKLNGASSYVLAPPNRATWIQFVAPNSWSIIADTPAGGGDVAGSNQSWLVTGLNGVPMQGALAKANAVWCYDGSAHMVECDLAQYPQVVLNNDPTTGTTLNTLTKIQSGNAIIAATTDSAGMVGITVAGAGKSGAATIQLTGLATCVFDNSTTAGDFVGISASVPGDCHDAGANAGALLQSQKIGKVLATNSGPGAYQIMLYPVGENVRTQVDYGSQGASAAPTTSGGSAYFNLQGPLSSATEANVNNGPVPANHVFSNLCCVSTVASGSAVNWSVVLRANGTVPSGEPNVTLSNTTAPVCDTIDTYTSSAAGTDLLDLKITCNGGTCASGSLVRCSTLETY